MLNKPTTDIHIMTGKFLWFLNVIIFLSLMCVTIFLLIRGQTQYGIDILFAAAFYLIFTKLDKIERVI